MKKYMQKFLIALFALVYSLGVYADGLSMSGFNTLPGATPKVSVSMTNTTNTKISGVQFDLVLPTGITLSSAAVNTTRKGSFSYEIDTQAQSDGSIRIICYSANEANATFTGTSGEVMSLTLSVGSGAGTGDKTITLKNQLLTTSTLADVSTSTATATMHIHSLTKTAAKAATCTTAGNPDYWYCSSCKKYFTNAASTTGTATTAPTLAALGHNYTYTSNGETTHHKKCSRCSDEGDENHTKNAEGTCTLCGACPVTGVTISATRATVEIGKTTTLTASVTPSAAMNKNITWSSSDETIATVSSTGVVTAVAVGKATITATSAADATKKATCTVSVANLKVGDLYYKVIDATNKKAAVTYATTDYNSYSGDVVIPAKVTISGVEYSVTEIGEYAFKSCSGVTSISLPNTIITMGNESFLGCTNMKKVYISDLSSFIKIGHGDYRTPLYFAHNLYINGTLLSGELVIPSDITHLNYRTLSYLSNVTKIIIPNTVTSMSSQAFSYMTDLETVIIGSGLNNINANTFIGDSKLKNVYLQSSSVPVLNETGAFSSKPTIHVYSNLLDNFKSSKWASLYELTLTDDFDNPSAGSLSTIVGTNPTSLKVSGDLNGTDIKYLRSLINDYSLTDLDMSGANIVAGGEAYYSTLTTSANCFPQDCFRKCTKLSSIKLPNSVTKIGMFALSETSIKTLTIPAAVTSMEHGIVSKTTTITEILVDEGNQTFISVDGVLYTKNNTTLHTCPAGKTGEITVLEGTQILGPRAFNSLQNVTSVILPSSLNTINGSCFGKRVRDAALPEKIYRLWIVSP